MIIERVVWAVSAIIILGGAAGVVLFRNPVHNALSLIATLFGVAVMFVIQKAYFLAAIQVIVYAGAIVILFLFVIMLLGVDEADARFRERAVWRRPAAIGVGLAIIVLVGIGLLATTTKVTGQHSVTGRLVGSDVNRIGKVLFTDYVWAFEITAVLLTVAVIGAVVLSRKVPGPAIDLDEFPAEPDFDDEIEEVEEIEETSDEVVA